MFCVKILHTKKPENHPTLRLVHVFLIRTRRIVYEPQPPPQEWPPTLQADPLPPDENRETSFLAFVSLQYGQAVSSAFAVMDWSSTKSFPQASH
jgi:hypothetical protein